MHKYAFEKKQNAYFNAECYVLSVKILINELVCYDTSFQRGKKATSKWHNSKLIKMLHADKHLHGIKMDYKIKILCPILNLQIAVQKSSSY